jgi:hypothetical protein
MPSASSGKKNPFPSLLPPGIRSSGCGSGRSLPTLILQPAIGYIFDIYISPAQCVKYSCGRTYNNNSSNTNIGIFGQKYNKQDLLGVTFNASFP